MDEFRLHIAEKLADEAGEIDETIIEIPPNPKMGDYAFPCFTLSKKLKKAPNAISQWLSEKIKPDEVISSVKSVGPYLNFFIEPKIIAEKTLTEVNSEKENFGSSEEGKGKTIIVDYSAPNVAKNMGIHNLRSTIIGQAICNIHKFSGYNVVGVNHLGDWGTQFGKLIWALEKWSSMDELKKKGIVFLNDMYVKFHEEHEKTLASNPDTAEKMEEEARAWFKNIEKGDKKAREWWKLFVEISLKDYDEIYERLNIEFEETKGESFYIQFLDDTIKTLEKAKLTSMSEGALVVEFDEKENMPPCLLKKTDGATLYGTRDVAAGLYRLREYKPYKALYVTDISQALHFKQVFKVLELLDKKNSDVFEHVQFGRLSFKDAAMSTRKGNIVPLREVLDKAHDKALEVIEEKNPDLSAKEDVAESVGVGAIIFGDLVNDRIRNIEFSWEKILSFEGETGPYVQYAHARICSILRKYGNDVSADVEFELLSSDEEKELIKKVAAFKEAIYSAGTHNKPSIIAKYLVELGQTFGTFYTACPVLKTDNPELVKARILLCDATRQVLKNGLTLLGLDAPEEM